MRLVLRGFGWLCIASGLVVALYLVYNLYWTGRETARAQDELRQEFEALIGDLDAIEPVQGEPTEEPDERADPVDDDTPAAEPAPTELPEPEPVEVGDALAAIQFVRPGEAESPLLDDPLLIVEGVTVAALKNGPGHYPETALPGHHGNFAVAGHRTTYGAPFFNLDRAQAGDQVHVTDRNGQRWVYEIVDQVVVPPSAVYVLEPDPLDLGRPMLTLTTCEPRFSNRERLITYAALIDEQIPLAAGDPMATAMTPGPGELVGEDA